MIGASWCGSGSVRNDGRVPPHKSKPTRWLPRRHPMQGRWKGLGGRQSGLWCLCLVFTTSAAGTAAAGSRSSRHTLPHMLRRPVLLLSLCTPLCTHVCLHASASKHRHVVLPRCLLGWPNGVPTHPPATGALRHAAPLPTGSLLPALALHRLGLACWRTVPLPRQLPQQILTAAHHRPPQQAAWTGGARKSPA